MRLNVVAPYCPAARPRAAARRRAAADAIVNIGSAVGNYRDSAVHDERRLLGGQGRARRAHAPGRPAARGRGHGRQRRAPRRRADGGRHRVVRRPQRRGTGGRARARAARRAHQRRGDRPRGRGAVRTSTPVRSSASRSTSTAAPGSGERAAARHHRAEGAASAPRPPGWPPSAGRGWRSSTSPTATDVAAHEAVTFLEADVTDAAGLDAASRPRPSASAASTRSSRTRGSTACRRRSTS